MSGPVCPCMWCAHADARVCAGARAVLMCVRERHRGTHQRQRTQCLQHPIPDCFSSVQPQPRECVCVCVFGGGGGIQRGGGSETAKFLYQKWPNQIVRMGNAVGGSAVGRQGKELHSARVGTQRCGTPGGGGGLAVPTACTRCRHGFDDAAPPPLVQAKVNDQKLTEPTLSIAWTRVLLTRYSVHGTCGKTRCTILKIKGQNMLQKAIMPQSASLTQNMDIMHLKTQGIRHIAHSRTH